MNVFIQTPQGITLSPTSATVTTKNPWFVPDGPCSWQARLFLGARISRLGMNIAPKFANRYYDALCLIMHPQNILETPYEWTRDGAIILGPAFEIPQPNQLTVKINGAPAAGFNTGQTCPKFDQLIAHISLYHTLKHGDIVAFELNAPPLPLAQQTNIAATIGSACAFTLKIR